MYSISYLLLPLFVVCILHIFFTAAPHFDTPGGEHKGKKTTKKNEQKKKENKKQNNRDRNKEKKIQQQQ
jgi:hypothetical protein